VTHNIQASIAKQMRQITLNHPSRVDVLCFRKVFEGVPLDAEPTLAGVRILGGNRDAADYDWLCLGEGGMLFTVEPFGNNNGIGAGTFVNDERQGIYALIEPIDENTFAIQKSDVAYVLFDGGVGLAYEVVDMQSPLGFPNGLATRKYQLNRRDDLDYINAFQE
jgi:hypothetical protein